MRININNFVFLLIGLIGCGAPLRSEMAPSGPKAIALENNRELEPEATVIVEPLSKGPVLPLLKRPTAREAEIEKKISQLNDEKRFVEILPLLRTLRKGRPDDPYLIDDQIWTCVEVPKCKETQLKKYLDGLIAYNKDYPKDVNRRITEMDVWDLLKKHKDLYTAARRFTIHHPTIAEGWIYLGEQQLRFYKPNRAQSSLKMAEKSTFRKKHNRARLRELETAIAAYVPPGYDRMVAANEKEAEEFEKNQNILLIRRDFARGGSESDLDGGGDY